MVLTVYPSVGMVNTMKSKDLIRAVRKAGWVEERIVGSHHIFKHPGKPGYITVPHPKKELGAGLVHKLEKQAGLK
jgi:predicted RNA binding protein YcfA (HicA-like mRNA interferase family)